VKDLAEARVAVIGGGVAGCSLAYHLTKLGWDDVVLLEADELTSGSTWHAAGLCTQFNASYNIMGLRHYSVDLYGRLEAETGHAVDFHPCGSVRLCSTQDRLDEFHARRAMAGLVGLPFEIVGPDQIAELHPLVETREDAILRQQRDVNLGEQGVRPRLLGRRGEDDAAGIGEPVERRRDAGALDLWCVPAVDHEPSGLRVLGELVHEAHTGVFSCFARA